VIKFEKSFLHIHVYEGGGICMPILEREYWKSKTTMTDLIQRIVNLIHQDINPFSPANASLYQLYKEDTQKY
jgi:ubiquitin-protein ligase